LFLTGGRISEVLRLKWDDITENHVILRSRKHRYGDLKTRHIPLSPLLKETLASIPRKSDYIFANTRTRTKYVYRPALLENLCAKAGIKEFGYHGIILI
jgi:integrase